ncbi:MAG: hypothetical protein R3A44_17605 [Caldilineaceae bacterium]
MSQHEQLRTYCKSLRLPSLSEVLVETLKAIAANPGPSRPVSSTCWNKKVEGRRRRRIERFLLPKLAATGQDLGPL